MRADQVVIGQPGQRQHRLAVELGIVQPIEQMQSAGSRGGQAYAELARELGIAARHERRCFFVPDLNEANLVLALPQRFHEPVDAISRKPKNDLYSPILDGIQEHFRCRGHGAIPLAT